MFYKNPLLIALILIITSCACLEDGPCTKDNFTTPPILTEKTKTNTVYFDTDKFELTKKAQKFLQDEILPELNNDDNSWIIVSGYCDERGSFEYNKTLAFKRANSLKKFFIKHNVNPERILVYSYGKLYPVDSSHNEKAWAQNRRVIVIMSKDIEPQPPQPSPYNSTGKESAI